MRIWRRKVNSSGEGLGGVRPEIIINQSGYGFYINKLHTYIQGQNEKHPQKAYQFVAVVHYKGHQFITDIYEDFFLFTPFDKIELWYYNTTLNLVEGRGFDDDIEIFVFEQVEEIEFFKPINKPDYTFQISASTQYNIHGKITGIYVESFGDLVYTDYYGNAITINDIPAGTYIPISDINQISLSTTISGIAILNS